MKYAKCVIGNSSSGIIEAPFLKVPTINIGNRQKGRIRAKSIIDTDYNSEEIYHILKEVLEDNNYVRELTSEKYPFGDGQVSKRVVNAIKKSYKNESLTLKKISYEVKENEWHEYW